MIKAVIFDMDGTMFDTETVTYEAYSEVAEELGVSFTKEYYMTFVGQSTNYFHSHIREDMQNEALATEFLTGATDRYMAKVMDEGLPEKYGLHYLLQNLKNKKVAMYVASSSRHATVEKFLKKAKVMHYFDGFIGGDEVEHAKPAPDIFLKAFEMTGLTDKSECLILEDSYHGVQAAYDAGIDVIMIPDLLPPTNKTYAQVKAVVPTLEDVLPFIK